MDKIYQWQKPRSKRFVYHIGVINKDRKWFEIWKPEYYDKYYYLKVKNGYVVVGEEVKE
jgi:hypothetical protein